MCVNVLYSGVNPTNMAEYISKKLPKKKRAAPADIDDADDRNVRQKVAPEDVKIALIIGPTGAGKSSAIELMTNARNIGRAGFTSATGTTTPYTGTGPFEGITFLDTPGLRDSEGKDDVHLTEMHQHLQTYDTIHHVLYMVRADGRFDQYMQDDCSAVKDMLGVTDASKIIIVLTGTLSDKHQEEMDKMISDKLVPVFGEGVRVVPWDKNGPDSNASLLTIRRVMKETPINIKVSKIRPIETKNMALKRINDEAVQLQQKTMEVEAAKKVAEEKIVHLEKKVENAKPDEVIKLRQDLIRMQDEQHKLRVELAATTKRADANLKVYDQVKKSGPKCRFVDRCKGLTKRGTRCENSLNCVHWHEKTHVNQQRGYEDPETWECDAVADTDDEETDDE